MAANTYGVTPTTLQAFAADLTIDDFTSPKSDQVVELIAAHADSLRGEADAVGLDWDAIGALGDTSANKPYGVLRLILINQAIAAVFRAKGRGVDAEGYAREAGMALNRLKRPQTIDKNATADLAESTTQHQARTGRTYDRDTASVAGRIIGGGSL